MHHHKQQFISLSLDHGVLRFGEFELKSGRLSPYFFNAGLFSTGSQSKNPFLAAARMPLAFRLTTRSKRYSPLEIGQAYFASYQQGRYGNR